MQIIPAIDLRDKKVVRLYRGMYDQQTVYSDDPAAIAMQWKEQGATLLHIVDLDGALNGVPSNLDVVKTIVEKVKLNVHFGGGVRSRESIDMAFSAGVHRVLMSTKVFEDPRFLSALPDETRRRIIVSIDSKSGIVMEKGWKDQTNISIFEGVKLVESSGIETAVVTDVASDGTLGGPNLEMLSIILETTKMKIIAAGGITTLDDIAQLMLLKKKHDNLYGGIIGKALYEGKINLKEAIRCASQETEA